MRRLFIIRHGNTFASSAEACRIGSRTDIPLVESGHAQAERLGTWFAQQPRPIRHLLSSPLLRARQTAAAITDATGHDLDGTRSIMAPTKAAPKPMSSPASARRRWRTGKNGASRLMAGSSMPNLASPPGAPSSRKPGRGPTCSSLPTARPASRCWRSVCRRGSCAPGRSANWPSPPTARSRWFAGTSGLKRPPLPAVGSSRRPHPSPPARPPAG